MDSAYVSALSALAGSAIGALASFGTTWLTQHHQDRSQRLAQENARREKLYGDFINEASVLFADALVHTLDDPSKMAALYALFGKLRLFASDATVSSADAVMHRILKTYYSPNEDLSGGKVLDGHLDVLREFTLTCRNDLKA